MQKHSRAYDPEDILAAKRLRANFQDLYASNLLTAKRTQELLNDGAAAGAADCNKFVKPLSSNSARNLRTTFSKNNPWPEEYVFDVPCLDRKTNKIVIKKMSMMLISEVLEGMADRGDVESMYCREGMDPNTLKHVQACEVKAGCRLAAISLWGDGAPCNWDRTESMEVFAWHLIGLPGESSLAFVLSLCVFPSVPLALFLCLPHEGNNLALFLIVSLRCSFYLTLVVFMRSVSQCLHVV